jgi:hypothetical protein
MNINIKHALPAFLRLNRYIVLLPDYLHDLGSLLDVLTSVFLFNLFLILPLYCIFFLARLSEFVLDVTCMWSATDIKLYVVARD